jgi:hypothetical protein
MIEIKGYKPLYNLRLHDLASRMSELLGRDKIRSEYCYLFESMFINPEPHIKEALWWLVDNGYVKMANNKFYRVRKYK